MWILIIGFGCNFVMQTISYSFYKGAKQIKDASYIPVSISFNKNLTGYGYSLEKESEQVILFFGGSNDIAYNAVAKYAGSFDCPFLAADYYGSQKSKGKMNLATMKKTAEEMYEWAANRYPGRKIMVMGHSYGVGMAAYLGSAKKCDALILLAGYRDVSDLYNKIIPIFWGPAKVFISNNMDVKEYAKHTQCKTYIIGSDSDKTLTAGLQRKLGECYADAIVRIFEGISHESYLLNEEVTAYVNGIMDVVCEGSSIKK
ncbi:MAG: alpha/beta hydrolase [Lachnospiraceae bacterium]|nr:alpha/beta hydrolase [Lachnospiraceae bacterium]